MAVSQNGYLANDRSVITTFIVSDSGRKMSLRRGSPGELLAHFVRWFDRNIRNIDSGILDDWSYAEREIRGGVELSNHASGTAADVDATKWPLGVEASRYLTPAEIAKVHEQLKLYEGCIRWGGDYTGRKDPMHFEINRDEAACNRVWAKIRQEDDMATVPQQEWNDVRDSIAAMRWIMDPVGGEAQGELLTRARDSAALLGALAQRDPAAIASAIPQDLAQQVIEALGAKLKG